jgi:hypothetical protein
VNVRAPALVFACGLWLGLLAGGVQAAEWVSGRVVSVTDGATAALSLSPVTPGEVILPPDVDAALARLRSRIGTIVIRFEAAGLDVRIDGREPAPWMKRIKALIAQGAKGAKEGA